MRKVSSEVFVREASRLGSVVAQVPVLDVSGIELHDAGDRLGSREIESVRSVPLDHLFFVEPGEDRRAARRGQGVQEFPIAEVPVPSVLAENVLRRTGQLMVRAGTILTGAEVEPMKAEGVAAVAVRTDPEGPAIRRARSYLDRCPPPPPRLNRPRPASPETSAWALVVPMARVLVAVRDDMTRLRLVNQLLSSGQEPVAVRSDAELRDHVDRERFDLVLTDAEGALAACAAARASAFTRSSGVIVCHGGTQTPVVAKALKEGANGYLQLPARLERVVETVWSCLRLQGKNFGVPPAILRERRQSVRARAVAELRLQDPAQPRALAVTTASLAGYSEGGLGIEYGILGAIQYDHYVTQGVHPRHPLYPYARSNPIGRELIVTLSKPGRSPVDVAAQVVHVGPSLRSDLAGLTFVKGPSMGVIGLLGPTRS